MKKDQNETKEEKKKVAPKSSSTGTKKYVRKKKEVNDEPVDEIIAVEVKDNSHKDENEVMNDTLKLELVENEDTEVIIPEGYTKYITVGDTSVLGNPLRPVVSDIYINIVPNVIKDDIKNILKLEVNMISNNRLMDIDKLMSCISETLLDIKKRRNNASDAFITLENIGNNEYNMRYVTKRTFNIGTGVNITLYGYGHTPLSSMTNVLDLCKIVVNKYKSI